MSPAGFNTNTLMTNNVCSMISCHCQNLVLNTPTEFSVTNLFYLHLSEWFFTMLFNRTGDYFGTKHFWGNILLHRENLANLSRQVGSTCKCYSSFDDISEALIS